MDGATLQSKAYAGYAKAAQRIGTSFSQYRPSGANNPTAAPARNSSLLASFNAEDFTYGRPNKYGKPTWFALLDGSQTEPGDYLIGNAGEGTYFIAAQQPLLPILAVQCNRTVSFYRPVSQTQVGAISGYEGNTPDTQKPLALSWPASVLQGTKGEANKVGLPGDVRSPWWVVLVPNLPGVTLDSSDIIEDDIGRRYIVSSAEQTDLGWRITAQEAQT